MNATNILTWQKLDWIVNEMVSSFKVYASQKVWAEASLSKNHYQCNVDFDLVLFKCFIQVKYNKYY